VGIPLNAQDQQNVDNDPDLDWVIYDDASTRTANTGPPKKS
jgi:hypothetical protein